MSRIGLLACVIGAAFASSGCPNAGDDRVLAIRSTGIVAGLVFLDANGSLAFEAADTRLEGVGVRLLTSGSRAEVAAGSTDAQGQFAFTGVVVGSYVLEVEGATLGDSVQVLSITPAEVSLQPEDSIGVQVLVSYPRVTTLQARTLPEGTRAFVVAVALNGRATFGDETVHVADNSGALRLGGVSSMVSLGDSSRFLGRRGARDGQPTLEEVTAFRIAAGAVPAARSLTTAQAASATGGTLDAALVAVSDVPISDSTTAASGDYVVTVNDGSGPLAVVFDRDLTFLMLRTRFVPGAVIDATGLLVPGGPGAPWQLKPRGGSDVAVN
jgi:hypothetical protein